MNMELPGEVFKTDELALEVSRAKRDLSEKERLLIQAQADQQAALGRYNRALQAFHDAIGYNQD